MRGRPGWQRFEMAFFHTAHLRARVDVVEQFRARLLRHARTSLEREPDCHSFDIHQATSDPALFLLIEIYTDEAAFKAHQSSAHFHEFRADVRDWVVDRKWWFWSKLEAPGS